VNPEGCQVYSFKRPTPEEFDHDFLWRTARCLPERGRIGIFNRSYYEEVLVTRVHPEYLKRQKLPEPVDCSNGSYSRGESSTPRAEEEAHGAEVNCLIEWDAALKWIPIIGAD